MGSTTFPKGKAVPWGAVVLWLGLWQVVSVTLGSALLLPSPLSTLLRLGQLCLGVEFYQAMALSGGRMLAGFFLAVVLATAWAFAAHKWPWCHQLLLPPLGAMKAVPVASFIILALVWIPTVWLSAFISFIMAFPPIYTNVATGLKETDRQLLEMAQVFGVGKWSQLRGIVLPGLAPYLQAGWAVAIGLCWKAAIAAEFIGLPAGTVGRALYNAKIYLQITDMFAWTVGIVVVSMAMERALLGLLGWCVKKGARV